MVNRTTRTIVVGIAVCAAVGGSVLPALADSVRPYLIVPVQIPYEMPPKGNDTPALSVPQNTNALSPEELQRAEALIPLLEGKQEFWAMGEFVHLGEPAVPVLVKALSMPGPRIRYNAIETISMLKAVAAVPSLITVAKEP
ncbi:hypothetical protein, partial [Petrachloros mirabilis]